MIFPESLAWLLTAAPASICSCKTTGPFPETIFQTPGNEHKTSVSVPVNNLASFKNKNFNPENSQTDQRGQIKVNYWLMYYPSSTPATAIGHISSLYFLTEGLTVWVDWQFCVHGFNCGKSQVQSLAVSSHTSILLINFPASLALW